MARNLSIRTPTPEVSDERPHGCYEGFVYLGHLVPDKGADEDAEVIERVPCRRCRADSEKH